MKHTPTAPRFKTSPRHGLLIRVRGKTWHRICDYVEIAGEGREEQADTGVSPRLFVVIDFKDSYGQPQQITLPRRYLRRPHTIVDELVDYGFNEPRAKRDVQLLFTYLRTARTTDRYTIVSRTGWINRRCYRRPDGEFLGKRAPHIIYQPAGSLGINPKSNGGSLKEWIAQVATPARDSKLLMAFIAVSFSALLLDRLGLESFILHIFSKDSSIGKTLAEIVAQSVHCEAHRNLLHNWDSTKASREELAAEHCDRVLVFDETGHLIGDEKHAAAAVQETAFMITAGRGRLRSAVWAKEMKTCTWRAIGISSGEKPIAQIVDEAHRQRLQGDEVRLLDVPACGDGAQYGVFDSLPDGVTSSRSLAKRIERACARNFGYPAREFVARMVKSRGLTKSCQRWMKNFIREVKVSDNNGWEGRFADRFALAYAAGRLAIEWDILPWSRQALLDAVVTVYQASRSVVPRQESTADIKARISAGLRDMSRIRDLRSTAQHSVGPNVQDADGFIKKDKGAVYYVIKPAALQRWVGGTVDLAALGKELLHDGHLITENGRSDVHTKQVEIGGISGKRRYYCISENLISPPES